MNNGKGPTERQDFELIRSTDKSNSRFYDKRGQGILEKLVRQDHENRDALERAHEYLKDDQHYPSAMHAAALSMKNRKIRIFISYKLDTDTLAAKAIAEVFRDLSDMIEVTYAGEFIEKNTGRDFREEIHRAISESHWFVLLLSDPKQAHDWSMFETGMFRASMVSKRLNRLICIHHPDAQPPDQIFEYQAVSATNENLARFLNGIVLESNPLPGWEALNPGLTDSFIEFSANRILQEFRAPSKPVTFNRCVKIRVSEPAKLKSWEDLEFCAIEPDVRSLELFGKSQKPDTWGRLIENVSRESNSKKWLEELHAIILKAISGNAFRPISSTFECSSGGRVMRPILHSMETDGTGEIYDFNLYFLDEISTAPANSLSPRLQALLTTLRMAARVRWEVLERFECTDWNENLARDCEMAFSRIEREGHLFGSWDVEELCLNYDKPDREEVRNLVNRWRALKGFRRAGAEAGVGELDRAFREFDVERIRDLMAECRDLINRFLSLSFPVLGKIVQE